MTIAESSRSKYIDMDKMVSFMTKEINYFWSLYDPSDDDTKICPIYRVPEHILEIDRIPYEPFVVSFGPYHHGAQHLEAMEKKKWEYLDRVLKLNRERTLCDYLKSISGLEKQARKCYSDEIKMERKKFLQMLLLDGCFILVNIDENVGTRVSNARVLEPRSFHKETDENMGGEAPANLKDSSGGVGPSKYKEHGYAMELELIKVEASQESGGQNEIGDANHMTNMENCNNAGDWLSCATWHDMFLLENQIPFFIVESIYELVTGTAESLCSKTAEFVEAILGHYPIAIQEFDRPKQFHHLLHLCHMYFRPSKKIDEELVCQPRRRYFVNLLHLGYRFIEVDHKPVDADKNLEQMDCFQAGKLRTRWRRAVEYHQAGVQFKKRQYGEQSKHSLLDIRFVDGVIEVPCLPIDESSESLFKNLLSLEQIDRRFGNDISAYVTFMSQVLATPADATLLVQRGIIVHMLDSDDEVSELFTRLTKQVTFRFDWNYYLKSLCQVLEAHYQSRLNRWIALLWLNHFGNPWLALVALAGIVVLACTIVQTIYTVLSYIKPPPDI